MMFNKHWSEVTIPNQIKPTRWIYVLHNLQGHLSVSQFLFLDLNVDKDVSCLQFLGKIFQILAPKKVIVSVPYLTELTLLLLKVSTFQKLYAKFLNLKTSSMITGFKLFFVLKISEASIFRFLWCIDTDYFASPTAERLTHNLYKQFSGHVHEYSLYNCLFFYHEPSIPVDNIQTEKRWMHL